MAEQQKAITKNLNKKSLLFAFPEKQCGLIRYQNVEGKLKREGKVSSTN